MRLFGDNSQKISDWLIGYGDVNQGYFYITSNLLLTQNEINLYDVQGIVNGQAIDLKTQIKKQKDPYIHIGINIHNYLVPQMDNISKNLKNLLSNYVNGTQTSSGISQQRYPHMLMTMHLDKARTQDNETGDLYASIAMNNDVLDVNWMSWKDRLNDFYFSGFLDNSQLQPSFVLQAAGTKLHVPNFIQLLKKTNTSLESLDVFKYLINNVSVNMNKVTFENTHLDDVKLSGQSYKNKFLLNTCSAVWADGKVACKSNIDFHPFSIITSVSYNNGNIGKFFDQPKDNNMGGYISSSGVISTGGKKVDDLLSYLKVNMSIIARDFEQPYFNVDNFVTELLHNTPEYSMKVIDHKVNSNLRNKSSIDKIGCSIFGTRGVINLKQCKYSSQHTNGVFGGYLDLIHQKMAMPS